MVGPRLPFWPNLNQLFSSNASVPMGPVLHPVVVESVRGLPEGEGTLAAPTGACEPPAGSTVCLVMCQKTNGEP